MSIKDKLAAIQQAIEVPKGRDNDFAGFKYRSAEDILEKVKPLLDANKTIIVLTDELQEMSGQTYVKGIAKLIDLESDDLIETQSFAREEKQRPKMSEGQLTGAASSYARKYALNGLLLLDDNKDPDSQNNTKTATKPQVSELDRAKDALNKMFIQYGHTTDAAKKQIIDVVTGQTKITTVMEVNAVMQALEDGLV